ncbi:hypothetical protein TanjilG_03383 [Lupinus angustifolius]|uniref:SWI/SNF complex subunit SWI3D n=1 Tax=Lupinus angustifolius TaxID=3871 RepID=A0A4P1RDW3_LUPAN|nr:PREDICTED: SWI/SNF complex subunit SWI3D [Lupinus angustifolius]OIW08707.1 hypothetical protein TanjilG_03383 [Lupinus angustifolius]
MEEKRRDAAPRFPSPADSPSSEPTPTRRRAGGHKRKANASNSSSTPSKRATREKASLLHPPPLHNGPLTRARQIPTNLSASVSASAAAAASSSAASGGSDSAPALPKHSEHVAQKHSSGGESVVLAEEQKEESELESVEAAIEAEVEAIRSRGTNAHVVPTHCGWFSWTDIHPIEKLTLPSFFNGKTENQTLDTYMEIRNWIMNTFHANPNIQVELKDLSELNVGDLNARQKVMEFLDYWGLINFHPFPALGSAVASASDDGEAENNPLLQKLYHFETVQLCPPVAKKPSLMTPAMTSGLFPESTIAEESVKQEGPAVEMLEYHCNSCAGDCSRKRYHCQKQADFDLCTDCFSNSRFGAGMSPLDFILMEPAEAAGVSGGKWTDQETLLLLEALELYKENWNEIAEHVGTKSKAQCILHFVQMPIEDVFIDSDDADASCKETADLSATNKDPSLQKDSSENAESNANDGIEDLDKISKAEDDKVKINQETPTLEDGSDEKTSEETSKSEDTVKVKRVQEVGNDCALNALKEAFADVGYSPGPECPSSFAEVGNPVMALASFLAHLVSSDVAVASAHSFLKSMSGNSPGTELAARHCFLLEDPPYNKKEAASSERDSKKEREQESENLKKDKPAADDKDLPNDDTNMKIDNNVLEDNRQLASTDDGDSEKPFSSKEQAMINHETLELDKCKDLSHSKLPNNQAPSTLHDSGGSTSKDEISPTEELHEGTLVKEPCNPVEELKDGHVSDSLLSEKHLQPVETPKDAEMASDSKPSDKSIPQKLQSTNAVHESLETADSEMDVDMVCRSLPLEKSDSQPLSTAVSSQVNGIEKEVDMMSPSHPVRPNSETVAGEDHAENGTKVKDNSTKTKPYNNFEKLKHAAVSTLAAAAVKAKVLANEEDDQIRQLTSLLIERQLHKLEAKLAFFNDVENVVMRARDHLERSRQKLYHERALIIASRLGLPPSSSRGVPPSLPTNRIPVNFANSIPRSQNIINPQMLPTSRPVGTVATTIPSPLASATSAGSSVRPPSKEKLSFVGTK